MLSKANFSFYSISSKFTSIELLLITDKQSASQRAFSLKDWKVLHLLVDKEPSSSVHEVACVWGGVVALASCDLADLHLTRGKQVHARLGPVADGDVTSNGSDGEHPEVGEVFEERAIGSPHSELLLGELGQDTKETHLVWGLEERFLQVGALLGKLGEHIDFFINN